MLEKAFNNHKKEASTKKESYNQVLNLFLRSLQQEINKISTLMDKRSNTS